MKLQRNILIFQITSMLIFMLAIFSIVGYTVVHNQLEEVKSDAQSVADTVADRLDADEMTGYVKSGKTDERYDEIKAELRKIKENFPEVTYMYVFIPTDDNNVMYIYDIYTAADFEKYGDKEWEFGTTEKWDSTTGNLGLIYHQGIKADSLEFESSEFGYTTTRYACCYDSDGNVAAIVGIDYDLAKISIILSKAIGVIFSLILCFAALLIFAVFCMTKKRVVEPLQKIGENAVAFAESDHNIETVQQFFYEAKDDSKNEIDILGRHINKMMKDIDYYIAENSKIAGERERIAMELDMAAKIQSASLPKAFPQRDEFKLFASMDPAKEVGGDFYDFFMLDDDHIALVMADVSGKGIAAALFMMVSKILIENTLKRLKSPALTLQEVNNRLCANNEADMFVTVWLGVLDIKTGIITASNAGHEYPLIKEAGKEYRYLKDEHGFILSGIPDMTYKDYEIKLNPGDEILVYTDGVEEAFNKEQKIFGKENVLATLNSEEGGNPEKTISGLKTAIDDFVDGSTQFDDITMLNLVYMEMNCNSSIN